MRMYRLAICEDEREMRAELRSMCEQILTRMEVAHSIEAFDSAEALLAQMHAGAEYDLLCLDILMGGISGMELARRLRGAQDTVSILFITSDDGYMREGYDVHPLHYLLKPVRPEAPEEALRYDLSRRTPQPRLTLSQGRTVVSLPAKDIRFVESRNHDVIIHARGESYTYRSTMQALEAQLPADMFCRSHHSYLVNLSHISQVGAKELTLFGGERVPMSRGYFAQLQTRLVKYLNKQK